jgi:hypothetical protein
MKVYKFLILCAVMVSFDICRAQDSKCLNYVKFNYSVVDSNNGLSNGEILVKNLDQQQKLVWHLVPILTDNSYEKNNLEEGILKDIPPGEYYLIVRDLGHKGKCPVSKTIVIKR